MPHCGLSEAGPRHQTVTATTAHKRNSLAFSNYPVLDIPDILAAD